MKNPVFSIAMGMFAIFISGTLTAEPLPWEKDDLRLNARLSPFAWFATTQFQQNGTPFELLTEGSAGTVSAFGSRLDLDFVPFDNFSFFFGTEFKSITLVAPDSSANTAGFGDARFGGSYVAALDPVGVVVGGAITSPTGYSPDLGAFRPTLGDGVNVFEAFVQIGRSFDNPFFFVFETGYRLRGFRTPRGGGPTVKFSDIIPAILDLGFQIGDRFQFLMMGEMTFAIGEPKNIDKVTFVAPAKTHAQVGLGGRVNVIDSLDLGAYVNLTIAGRNEFNSTELGVNFSTTLDLQP